DEYFRTIAAAMVAHGWREGLAPNQHIFGRNLSKDGVNAILYPDRDSTTHGVGRIYGQCHDMNSHRAAAWVDVTDRLHYPVKPGFASGVRSEERRVGKECRSRWSPYH